MNKNSEIKHVYNNLLKAKENIENILYPTSQNNIINSIINIKEIKEDYDIDTIYQYVSNYKDLLIINQAFLAGYMPYTLIYGSSFLGQVEDTEHGLRAGKYLIEMSDYGILTSDGHSATCQPMDIIYEYTNPYDGPQKKIKTKSVEGTVLTNKNIKDFQFNQRSYSAFIIPKETWNLISNNVIKKFYCAVRAKGNKQLIFSNIPDDIWFGPSIMHKDTPKNILNDKNNNNMAAHLFKKNEHNTLSIDEYIDTAVDLGKKTAKEYTKMLYDKYDVVVAAHNYCGDEVSKELVKILKKMKAPKYTDHTEYLPYIKKHNKHGIFLTENNQIDAFLSRGAKMENIHIDFLKKYKDTITTELLEKYNVTDKRAWKIANKKK